MKFRFLILLFFGVSAFAKPYPELNIQKLAQENLTVFMNQYLPNIWETVAEFTAYYPPEFDNESDKERAKKDIQSLIQIFETLIGNEVSKENFEEKMILFHHLARLNWYGHHLEMPNKAETANQIYELLLRSNNKEFVVNIQEEYARFLLATNLLSDSEKAFRQAIELGNQSAYRGLIYLLVHQNKISEAKLTFIQSLKNTPKNLEIIKMFYQMKTLQPNPLNIPFKN